MTNDEYYLPDEKSKQVALAFTDWVSELFRSSEIKGKSTWFALLGPNEIYGNRYYSTKELYELWLKEQAE